MNNHDLLHGSTSAQEYKAQMLPCDCTPQERREQKKDRKKQIMVEICWAVFFGIGFVLMVASAINLEKILTHKIG